MVELRRNTATKQQLANDYEVSVKTISKWMRLAKLEFAGGILYPAQLREFYEKIGAPMVEKKEVA